MIKDKKVLAVTPARGRSKGLPGKNIKDFCGQPLIVHAVNISKKSKYIDRIMVSTDCLDIARVARAHLAEIHMRPAQLATDDALVIDVLRDLLDHLGETYDYLVLLEATSPLRTVEQVDGCIEVLAEKGADSIATFSKADPPPTRLWKLVNGTVFTYLEDANPWLPRQRQEEAFFLNGLVYAFDIKSFLRSDAKAVFFGNRVPIITQGNAVDIDTLEDFKLAEYFMRARNEAF